jgi:hypothetical protein
MLTPLTASAMSAGTLMASSTFEVPPYQREYAWEEDEIADFWGDLQRATSQDSYFLGLLIFTEDEKQLHVVDGQQRILSLTLLATALYHEAVRVGRKALAARLQSDFLYSMDYATDEVTPRVVLSDDIDDATLRDLVEKGEVACGTDQSDHSRRMCEAYEFLQRGLREDLKDDPFKRLGVWTEFITNKLYFAVFVHPDAASAYRVFEVINTRGKELTTAELLKNYILSQTTPKKRDELYERWQNIARRLSSGSTNTLVQYIRHVITVEVGYVLPKDLFDFVASRQSFGSRQPPSISKLMEMLEAHLPLYLQMMDQTVEGPADADALKIFSALNSLSVISVRPLLLAISEVPDAVEGMRFVLRLVVRRIVAGNLGTGNVERQLSDAAMAIRAANDWRVARASLVELNPTDDTFLEQIETRAFNKSVLHFLRRSLVQRAMTPDNVGVLHLIAPRQGSSWDDLGEEELKYWGGTLANTFLATLERRPKSVTNWGQFKAAFFPHAVPGEMTTLLSAFESWDAKSLQEVADHLAAVARSVWC